MGCCGSTQNVGTAIHPSSPQRRHGDQTDADCSSSDNSELVKLDTPRPRAVPFWESIPEYIQNEGPNINGVSVNDGTLGYDKVQMKGGEIPSPMVYLRSKLIQRALDNSRRSTRMGYFYYECAERTHIGTDAVQSVAAQWRKKLKPCFNSKTADDDLTLLNVVSTLPTRYWAQEFHTARRRLLCHEADYKNGQTAEMLSRLVGSYEMVSTLVEEYMWFTNLVFSGLNNPVLRIPFIKLLRGYFKRKWNVQENDLYRASGSADDEEDDEISSTESEFDVGDDPDRHKLMSLRKHELDLLSTAMDPSGADNQNTLSRPRSGAVDGAAAFAVQYTNSSPAFFYWTLKAFEWKGLVFRHVNSPTTWKVCSHEVNCCRGIFFDPHHPCPPPICTVANGGMRFLSTAVLPINWDFIQYPLPFNHQGVERILQTLKDNKGTGTEFQRFLPVLPN
eukprot:Lankesteria_metandrocarpae@DN9540_c0_g1_i1.p1